ncbi:MAG: hypothetical protein V1798_10960 [Pseudomonadota bacterium]
MTHTRLFRAWIPSLFALGFLVLGACGNDATPETLVPGAVKITIDTDARTITWPSIAGATSYNLNLETDTDCTDVNAATFDTPTTTDTKLENVTSPWSIADYTGNTTCYHATVSAQNSVGEGEPSNGVAWQIHTS